MVVSFAGWYHGAGCARVCVVHCCVKPAGSSRRGVEGCRMRRALCAATLTPMAVVRGGNEGGREAA